MGLMTGKRGVIFGVANDKSIAWGLHSNCMRPVPNWLLPT